MLTGTRFSRVALTLAEDSGVQAVLCSGGQRYAADHTGDAAARVGADLTGSLDTDADEEATRGMVLSSAVVALLQVCAPCTLHVWRG